MAEQRRRKSLSIFRPHLTPLAPIHDATPDPISPTAFKKKSRASSLFHVSNSTPSSPLERVSSTSSFEKSSAPLSRPRTLQKPHRASSIFGSFRSHHSLQDEDGLLRIASSPSSITEEGMLLDAGNMSLLHHGEVQTAGSMFRRRVQYLILTDTHLFRFKNQSKASEAFTDVPVFLDRIGSARHSRMGSGSSAEINVDSNATIPLTDIVAVYKLDDGRPYFTIEIAYYDEPNNQVSTMSLQLNDPMESEIWLGSIRAAITKARLLNPAPFSRRAIEYAARVAEHEGDYDPNHFRMFLVAQRASKSGGRSSSEDLGKLMTGVHYLIIGLHKIHVMPLPKFSRSASNSSLSDAGGTSHGIASLTSVYVQNSDDALQLTFRLPFQPQTSIHLASASVNDIALCIRQAADFIRPLWVDQPFVWHVPQCLDEALLPILSADIEDHLCFDRTLAAHCVGYNVDPFNIRYTVDYTCEDVPQFQLLEPDLARRKKYTAIELLAILRALRYNESFHSISFRQAKLDSLHGLVDRHGIEHFCWSTKSGQSIDLPKLDDAPLLVQELQCLALKSNRLRRIDFTNCLSRKPKDLDRTKEGGSGICEALFPLCALQLTNVNWIVLDGIALSEIDMEYLYTAALQRFCHFRAIDLGGCGLGEESLKIALQSMIYQEDTLESLNLSGNPGRLSAQLLTKQLSRFKHIRKLNMSKFQLSSGTDPILSFDVLHKWKLETLTLAGTILNTESVDSLSAYLMSDQSRTLRELHLEQCQLTGADVATLLTSMTSGRNTPRNLHLFISRNRVEREHDRLVKAVKRSQTPTRLTMCQLEYSDEKHFQDLLHAISRNKSLTYLDMSRVSIPYDASEHTCVNLRDMLETNNTLEELDISGEHAHLEAVNIGKNLPLALRGLEKNTNLKILRVEHQVLSLPGSETLASVLQTNTALRELYCEHNEISLQAFTTLVNAMKDNRTLYYLPSMKADRAWSRSKVDREVSNLLSSGPSHASLSARSTSTVKKALRGSVMGNRSLTSRTGASERNSSPAASYTEQDVQAAVASLDQRWNVETERLEGYLRRNYALANGTLEEFDTDPIGRGPVTSRPTTATLDTALKNASLDRTPTAELDRQLNFALGEDSPEEAETDYAEAEEGLVMGIAS